MRYIFGDCRLDTEQYVLNRAGHSISLQPKVFQVLQYLLIHRDRVVSKQELCEQIWPEQFISDASIEGVIKAIRQVVGDDGRTQWCIQTRRGQGYRFAASLADAEQRIPEPKALTKGAQQASSDTLPETQDVSRRHLTVLYCELVGAGAQSSQLDLEDWREIVLAYDETCATIMGHFGGSIAQHLNHGRLIYFGYPHAHEDDARRAVQAGLELLQAVQARHFRLEDGSVLRLALRAGLHTGTVVVSEIGNNPNPEPVALGAVPNIAVGLQRVAAPHTLVISADSHQLIKGFFACSRLGELVLQDVDASVVAYRVHRASDIQSRFDLAQRRGLTPLVGRVAEVALLQERWEQAKHGHGQVVLLSGEPGIGKSRLGRELQEYVVAEGGRSIKFRCSPYHMNSAFYPVIEYLQRHFMFRPNATPQEKLDKLAQTLGACPVPIEGIVPLFAAFLSLPMPMQYPPLRVNPERQKQLTREALVEWLLTETEFQPILMIWEELHWVDPSTRELLIQLIEQIPTTRLLCLLMFRPPFQPF